MSFRNRGTNAGVSSQWSVVGGRKTCYRLQTTDYTPRTRSARRGVLLLVVLSLLVLFFAYCYPISRLTQRLERRYAFYQ